MSLRIWPYATGFFSALALICILLIPFPGQSDPEEDLRDFSIFSYKSLHDTRATSAILKSLIFDHSILIGGDFYNSRLIAPRFELSDIRQVSFRGAILIDLRSDRSRFFKCDFRDANLRGAVFVLSDLSGSIFNDRTILPFSRETAQQLGMVHEE